MLIDGNFFILILIHIEHVISFISVSVVFVRETQCMFLKTSLWDIYGDMWKTTVTVHVLRDISAYGDQIDMKLILNDWAGIGRQFKPNFVIVGSV